MSAAIAAAWFASLASLASDDSTRPSICQTAVKVAPGVWACTNGHYAILSPSPAAIRAWCDTIPVSPQTPWPLDQLATQAKAGSLPEYTGGKIGEVRARDCSYPDIARVIALSAEKPLALPDLGAALAEIDAEIAQAKTRATPDPAVAVANVEQKMRLPKTGWQLNPLNRVLLYAEGGDDGTATWSCDGEVTTWGLDKDGIATATQTPVVFGQPRGKPAIGLDYRYLRKFAKLGPWGGGTWDRDYRNPANMVWGQCFVVMMPQRV